VGAGRFYPADAHLTARPYGAPTADEGGGSVGSLTTGALGCAELGPAPGASPVAGAVDGATVAVVTTGDGCGSGGADVAPVGPEPGTFGPFDSGLHQAEFLGTCPPLLGPQRAVQVLGGGGVVPVGVAVGVDDV